MRNFIEILLANLQNYYFENDNRLDIYGRHATIARAEDLFSNSLSSLNTPQFKIE